MSRHVQAQGHLHSRRPGHSPASTRLSGNGLLALPAPRTLADLCFFFPKACSQRPTPKGTCRLPPPGTQFLCLSPGSARCLSGSLPLLLPRPSPSLDSVTALGSLVPGAAAVSDVLLGACQSPRHQSPALRLPVPDWRAYTSFLFPGAELRGQGPPAPQALEEKVSVHVCLTIFSRGGDQSSL